MNESLTMQRCISKFINLLTYWSCVSRKTFVFINNLADEFFSLFTDCATDQEKTVVLCLLMSMIGGSDFTNDKTSEGKNFTNTCE